MRLSVSNNGTFSVKKETARQANGGAMLPQWALDKIRPVVGGLSRMLWKIEFYGVENIPERGGVIIAANHQTYMDPFWLSLKVKRPCRYLAWSAAFRWPIIGTFLTRSEEHTSELQSQSNLVCRLLLEKKKKKIKKIKKNKNN